jgi:hypothetical protein
MNAERRRQDRIVMQGCGGAFPALEQGISTMHAATTTITPQFLDLTTTISKLPPPSAHMPPERLAGCTDRHNAFPRFPFVDIALRSPRTPFRNSQTSSLQDAARTHPIDDPFYPSPFYGLSFSATGSGTLAREGALVLMSRLTGLPPTPSSSTPPNGSPEAREITYYEGWFSPVFKITSMS